MFRLSIDERPDWRKRADEYGFKFHTMYGEPYWDESAYYQFTLEQIEKGIEDPTEELHQMCLAIVDEVVQSEELLEKFQIPQGFWQPIADSWQRQDPSLYSRLDLVYDGTGHAKLLENNADTPTSLYESGFWQWLWLQDNVDNGKLSKHADQFNSLQEKLVNRFYELRTQFHWQEMHFACCQDTEEDRGTVQYLQDCAAEAGLEERFVFIEDIGLADTGVFTDTQDNPIMQLFKLYPWEFMQREEFGEHVESSNTAFLEPLWKTVLSNKALLPMLWKRFKGHPNLLPAWFDAGDVNDFAGPIIKKPIYSREGANISLLDDGKETALSQGPYGEEGFVYQAFTPLPKYQENYTLIGSWLVNDKAAGISVREDTSMITQDLSRYLPHIILG